MQQSGDFTYGSMDEIVFEDRNKSYGAYILRKLYQRNMLIALGIATSIFIGFFAISLWAVNNTEEIVEEVVVEVNLEALDLPPITPEIPPPPPPPAPKIKMPEVATKKFIPQEVVPDEKILVEEPVPTVDDLKDVAISNKDQEGDTTMTNAQASTEGSEFGQLGGEGDKFVPAPSMLPSFPGGNEAFSRCIQSNIVYPRLARMHGISGSIYIVFGVSAEGKLENVKIQKGLGYGLDEEALKAVEKCSNWNPGIQNGRKVRIPRMSLPIKIYLPED